MAQSIIIFSTIALLLCAQAHGSDLHAFKRHVRDLKIQAQRNVVNLAKLKAGSTDTTQLDNAIRDAKSQIASKSVSVACRNDADKKLDDLSKKTAQDWSDCTMTNAVEKLGFIAYDAADFAAGILVILDEYINGFYDCLSINPFTLIPCFFTYGYNSIKNIWTTISLIKTFMSNVHDNIGSVNKIISKACLALPADDIKQIVNDVSKCRLI